MPITLAVDFGSTYTKVVAIDCEAETLVGVAQSPTTVSEGVMLGLDRALTRLEAACGVRRADISRRLASGQEVKVQVLHADGGERKTIVRSAGALAAAQLRALVVVAGNRTAQDEVEAILREAGWRT